MTGPSTPTNALAAPRPVTRRELLAAGGLLAAAAAVASPHLLDSVFGGIPASERALVRSVFTKHLGTDFAVRLAAGDLALRLTAVGDHPWAGGAADAAEGRFVASFTGPAGQVLKQGTYDLHHPRMGRFALFLVPTSPDADGTARYDAVFNRI
jgi:hypothetical protein